MTISWLLHRCISVAEGSSTLEFYKQTKKSKQGGGMGTRTLWRSAALQGCIASPPKSARTGHPHALRLDLVTPDSRNSVK